MNIPIVVTAAGLAAGAAWLVAWIVTAMATRRARQEADSLRQDMQTLVSAQSQSVAAQLNSQIGAQIGQLSQTLTAQYGQVLQQVQSGMASAGSMASNAQKAVSDQLQASTEMLGTIRQQLGQVQQAGHELSDAAKQIENVLGGAKTRGVLGEVALERLLCDCLPAAAYETQYRFSTGEAVDAIVRSGEKLLSIDSKFPLDDYQRLIENGEDARDKFSGVVRKHAESIARKYILPSENTLDIALMFVPSEGVYYELLHTQDSKGGALDGYCRALGVIPVSPSTLYAYLQMILMGLRGMQIEENARRLATGLAGLEKQFDNFGELYEKMGTHLRNAQQCYSDADRKLERARNSLAEMAQGTPRERALQTTLPIE